MKVYIVQTCEHDDMSIHGVYSSRDSAERKMAELDEQARERARRMVERMKARLGGTPGYDPFAHIEDWRDHYMITEYEVIR